MVKVNTRGAFELLTRNGGTLVGGKTLIEIPGGKEEPCDGRNPLATVTRESHQEVAFTAPFTKELIFEEPLLLCLCPQSHMVLDFPAKADLIDIRYVYRFEGSGFARPQMSEEETFICPRFAPPKDLETLQAGTEIRYSAKAAIGAYAGKGAWPRVPVKRKPAPFGTVEEQFRKLGFPEAFIEAEVGPIRAAQTDVAFRQLAFA